MSGEWEILRENFKPSSKQRRLFLRQLQSCCRSTYQQYHLQRNVLKRTYQDRHVSVYIHSSTFTKRIPSFCVIELDRVFISYPKFRAINALAKEMNVQQLRRPFFQSSVLFAGQAKWVRFHATIGGQSSPIAFSCLFAVSIRTSLCSAMITETARTCSKIWTQQQYQSKPELWSFTISGEILEMVHSKCSKSQSVVNPAWA